MISIMVNFAWEQPMIVVGALEQTTSDSRKEPQGQTSQCSSRCLGEGFSMLPRANHPGLNGGRWIPYPSAGRARTGDRFLGNSKDHPATTSRLPPTSAQPNANKLLYHCKSQTRRQIR
jgi:hypothetical protein